MWPAVLRSGVWPRARVRAGARWPVVLLIAMLAVYAAVWLRALSAGVDDFNLAAVFSTDEPLAGRIVRRMVDEPTLNPSHFFAYGALYHEAAAAVLMPLAPSGVDQREVLLALRAVSLLGALATIALTFALGRRLFGPWAGLLAASLVAASTELAEWSVTAHPDTLQLALIAGALIAICALRDQPSRRLTAAAGLLAGLAFATKYGGALLLPLAALALACGLIARGVWGRALAYRLVGDVVLLGGVFAAAFVLTNPYAVVEWRRFLTQFRAEIEHAGQGHVTTGEASGLRWIGQVAARTFAGPLAVAAAVAGWATLWTRPPSGASRRPWQSLASRIDAPVLVGIWTFGYLAYLVAQIGYQAPRYALPLLPGLAVLAAGAVAWLGRRRPVLGIAAGMALLLVTAVAAFAPLRDLYDDRTGRAFAAGNPRIAAGLWLRDTVPPNASVLSDTYVYLPPSLTHAAHTDGLTEAAIARLRPVVIVTNEDIRGRFRDPAGGTRYVDGPTAYEERASAYARLERGELRCYVLVEDYGGVAIYADRRALESRAEQGC